MGKLIELFRGSPNLKLSRKEEKEFDWSQVHLFRFIIDQYSNFRLQVQVHCKDEYEIIPGECHYHYNLLPEAPYNVTIEEEPFEDINRDMIVVYKCGGLCYRALIHRTIDTPLYIPNPEWVKYGTNIFSFYSGDDKWILVGTIKCTMDKDPDTKRLISKAHDEWRNILSENLWEFYTNKPWISYIDWCITDYFKEVIDGTKQLPVHITKDSSGIKAIYGKKYLNKWIRSEEMQELLKTDTTEFILTILDRSQAVGDTKQWGSSIGIQDYLITIYDEYNTLYEKIVTHCVAPDISIRNAEDDVFISFQVPLCGFSGNKKNAFKYINDNRKYFIDYAVMMIKNDVIFKKLDIPFNMFKMYEMVITNSCELVIRFCLKDKLVQLLSQES